MIDDQIIDYIRQNEGVQTAELQKRFGMSYKTAKDIIDELLSKGDLEYAGGIRYNYIGKPVPEKSSITDRGQGDGEAKSGAERVAYLERRRREILERMKAEAEDDEDYDNEDEDDVGMLFSDEDDEDIDLDFDDDDIDEREINKKIDNSVNEIKSLEAKVRHFDRTIRGSLNEVIEALKEVIVKKSQPISVDVMPKHPSWDNETAFDNCVSERMKSLIKSDMKMGKTGAIKRAEAYLEGVRDTHDRKMMQVYERLVYELKNTSAYLYAQLKKQFRDG